MIKVTTQILYKQNVMDNHYTFCRYPSVGHTAEFRNFLNWYVIYSWQIITFVYM